MIEVTIKIASYYNMIEAKAKHIRRGTKQRGRKSEAKTTHFQPIRKSPLRHMTEGAFGPTLN